MLEKVEWMYQRRKQRRNLKVLSEDGDVLLARGLLSSFLDYIQDTRIYLDTGYHLLITKKSKLKKEEEKEKNL